MLDLADQKFNHLKVIRFDSMRKGSSYWLCECDCGNQKVMHGTSVKLGRSESCGCHGIENIIGKKFGKLTVVSLGGLSGNARQVICECECGNIVKVGRKKVMTGHTKSCGCLHKEATSKRFFKHGKAKTPVHNTYASMIDRCYRETHPSYNNYGGRGITVCIRWLESFENFYEDMGDRPEGHQLDRIDNAKGYSPENCRWATRVENCGNKRDNVLLTLYEETLCVSEWARKFGCPRSSLVAKLKKGLTIEAIAEFYKYK